MLKTKSHKLIFVGVFNKSSTNYSQAICFEKMGNQVIRYEYREIAQKIGNQKRDLNLIHLCQKEKPDFIFFSKCNEIHPFVVSECNKICKTILWYMDPKNGNYNPSLIAKIKHCTFTCFALMEPYLESKKYNSNIYFIQEGFDPNVDYPVNAEYKYDVSFIGNLRGKRRNYYNAVKFHNYTNVYEHRHSIAVAESKINLNFTEGGTSDRTYKILAAKGFLLTQPWPEMEKDFRIGYDLDIFTSIDTLKNKINFYLQEYKLRMQIAEQGFQTVQKFSRDYFARRIIEILQSYL